jgi:4-carboxymuconolactone decarboxylase
VARIPYATPAQCEELMREIPLPEEATRANAFRMLAHAPAIGGSVLRLIFTILAEADLDFFLHELVILRVTQHCQAHYAWTQHVAIAQAIGVTDTQIAALERGDAPADLFTRRERKVLAFTSEVLVKTRVSDHTFALVREELSSREMVELLLTIGYLRMIGGLLATLDVDLDRPCALELLEMAYEVA